MVTGPQGSGKTSFIHSLLGKSFNEKYNPTIGFNQYNLELLEFPPMKIRIWDMSGDPKYSIVCQKYYPDIMLDVIVTEDEVEVREGVPTIVVWSKADIHKTYPQTPDGCKFGVRWSNDPNSLANRSMTSEIFKYKLASVLINM